MRKFLKSIIVGAVLITTGCQSNEKTSGYMVITNLGSLLTFNEPKYENPDMEKFASFVHGDYEVEKFESIKFYVTDFTYDADAVTEYIKNSIDNNKEQHKITIAESTITYQGNTYNLEDYYASDFTYNSDLFYYDMEIGFKRDVDLEYDFLAGIQIRTADKGDRILVELLFRIEKYNYPFTTYVSYKRVS